MTNLAYIILLQASGPPRNPMIDMVFIALMFIVIIYFFSIRPQQKKEKERSQFIDEVQKGDEVVTNGGIVGKVNKIEDNFITLEVGTKTYIRVTKGAINKEMTESALEKSND